MNINIRQYNKEDFSLVKSWWALLDKGLSEYTYPEESSYILEINNKPLACASLYLMNSPIACMMENLISDPKSEIENKSTYINNFMSFLEQKAKDRGYISIIAMTYVDKLKDKYSTLGYKKITDNLTVFAKSLKEI